MSCKVIGRLPQGGEQMCVTLRRDERRGEIGRDAMKIERRKMSRSSTD